MSLQDLFYIIGIVAMALYILLLIVLVVVLLLLKKKITDISNLIEKNFANVKEAISHPGRIVSTVSEAMAGKAITHVTKMLKGKTHKR